MAVFASRSPFLNVKRPLSARRLGLIAATFAALALGGCDSTRSMLGLEKTTPDEFKIVSTAPLSLPPNYALRPPVPGASRPQEQSGPQRALSVVTGGAATQAAATRSGSSGEAAFLSHAGANRADPAIRTELERDSTLLAGADATFLDRVMFWRKGEDRSPVVDPTREAQRLRENAALGRPTTEGDTPTIVRRKKAPLEGIF